MKQGFKLRKKEVEAIVTCGGMAPSAGNNQPWKVKVEKDRLEVFLDLKRLESTLKVNKYIGIFSLGCFIENVCIKAEALGLSCDIKIAEGESLDNFRCLVLFLARNQSIKNNLASFIPKRVTNRQIYDGTIIDKNVLDQLKKETKGFGSNFKLSSISSEDDKKRLAEIIGIADAIRINNPQTLKEMMKEFRWSEGESQRTKDGLDLKTLELPGNIDKMFDLLRKFNILGQLIPKKVLGKIASPLIVGSSHLVCLSVTSKIGALDLYLAGRLSQLLWLISTKLGLAFHPWTALIYFLLEVESFGGGYFTKAEQREIKDAGKDLKNLFGLSDQETVLFLFRISHAKPPTAKSARINWRKYTTI